MIERALIVLALAVVGVVAFRLYTRYHLRKAAASAVTDPVLQRLQPGIPAIVYFTLPTCAPCRTQQQPALARLKDELGAGVQIVQVDASEDAEAAARWGVFSAPTTFILDACRQVREVNYGVADAQRLKQQLEATGAGI